MLKLSRKNIIVLSAILAVILITAIVLVVIFTKSENVWIPEVQGSHVSEMTYESLSEDYVVEKYTDYKSFSKSNLSDYEFVSGKKATEERYSKEYFEKFDLVVIKFNREQSGIKYYITDAVFSENTCNIEIIGTKKLTALKNQSATYYCFLETESDVTNCSFTLTIEDEIEHSSQSFNYVTMDNKFYVFEGNTEPEIFVIDSKQGLNEFVENDPVLTNQSYSIIMLSTYTEEFYEDNSLLLVRLLASDFETWMVSLENNSLRLVGFRTNHYLYTNETEYHILIAVTVPKDCDLQILTVEKYCEYEGGQNNNLNIVYSVAEADISMTDVTKYVVSKND